MDGLLGLLTPEQQEMARRDAISQGLLALGAGLIQGSRSAPGGRRPSLLSTAVRALPGAAQAYRSSFDQTLQDVLRAQQIQDLQRKRQQEILAANRQTQIQQAMALPDMNQRIEALRGLGAYEELSQMGTAEKAIRPLTRAAGEVSMENPFMVYQQSEIPGVKKLADQYAKAYETGAIDDEKAATRLGELGRMEESARARMESAAERKSREAASAAERQTQRDIAAEERERKRLQGTGEQLKAKGFANIMVQSEDVIDELTKKYGNKVLPTKTTSAAAGIPFIGGFAERAVMSSEQQQYKNAANAWIRSKLRWESGAAIGEKEMEDEYETYFPMPGDSPERVALKAELRKTATQNMIGIAGPLYENSRGNKSSSLKDIKSNYGLEP